ncbi:hypothetical protein PtrM4_075290 [Pyrenophora tritici-repentis]|uniref:Uncharacterized protein n=1 Tax=Pyrenophora tritici-repentis TaxID=45151 RepID=A0A834RZA5_9PLEO|nr:hypothetical protein PtrM4_075290 [Pyrenophora tritici-repentis]
MYGTQVLVSAVPNAPFGSSAALVSLMENDITDMAVQGVSGTLFFFGTWERATYKSDRIVPVWCLGPLLTSPTACQTW